jgi:hypothetical protein
LNLGFVTSKRVYGEKTQSREQVEIDRLLRKGFKLANIHHNPDRPATALKLWKAIRARITADAD